MTIKNMIDEETMMNIAELKGILSDAKRRGLTEVILPIPVRLMAIDTDYQTPIRTERELTYLTKNWDRRKIGVLMGVPHEEEGKIYLVDGYGRMTASQMVDPETYNELNVHVILDAPTNKADRKRFEAEFFADQGNNKAVTPLQKHGARRICDDQTVKIMDILQDEYKFSYKKSRGRRGGGIIGSYTELYSNVKKFGYDFGKFFFDICAASGFNRKIDGYAVYVMRSIRDLYKYYPKDRETIKTFLSDWMRKTDYRHISSNAGSKYELLGPCYAITMYFEDIVVDGTGLPHKRSVIGDKVVDIA